MHTSDPPKPVQPHLPLQQKVQAVRVSGLVCLKSALRARETLR